MSYTIDLTGNQFPHFNVPPAVFTNARNTDRDTGAVKRPRRSQSPRALSSQGFRHVRDETSGRIIPARRMSENASLDFNAEAAARYQDNPRDFEFRVLSDVDSKFCSGM